MSKIYDICIDLGGTKIKIALVSNGMVFTSEVIDAISANGLKERLHVIQDIVDAMLEKQQIPLSTIGAVCISVPGIVDPTAKRVLSIDKKFADAPQIDFLAWADACWHLPLFMDNDARCAMIGEWKHGAAKGYLDAAIMTLGTGIGSSAIMDGKIIRGKHFMAGILGGHSTIDLYGDRCNCGNIGCGETVIATWNIAEKITQHIEYQNSKLFQTIKLDFESVFKLASSDPLAQIMLEKALHTWGACAVNLIHAYDPEILVLSGGIMQSADVVIPAIQSYINKHAWTPWGTVQVVPAMHINEAAFLGAAELNKMNLST